MAEKQTRLEGTEYDVKVTLLGATTNISQDIAPQIGDKVKLTIEAIVADSGQKLVGEVPTPYLKLQCSSMRLNALGAVS